MDIINTDFSIFQQKYYKSLYKEDWIKDWVRVKYKDDFQNFNYELDI